MVIANLAWFRHRVGLQRKDNQHWWSPLAHEEYQQSADADISRVLKQNSCLAQEPASTRNTTKRVVEILDAKYDKADLPSIVKNNSAHLSTSHCNLLLALLLKFEELFDGMLGN
jgi:hypothetical protein